MANLRDLIDYADEATIQAASSLGVPGVTAGVTTSYFGNGFPGSEYKQIKYRGNFCTGNHTCQYECLVWRPPAGTTFVKFEIWGGGGGGPGSCCCMMGTPGGSGAYAYKCICTGYDLGGCIYEFCIAGMSCCSPESFGYRGCKSFAIGYGLQNFCAEGGGMGYSHCHCNWPQSCLCVYETSCNEGSRRHSCQEDGWGAGRWCFNEPWVCGCNMQGQPYGSGQLDCFEVGKSRDLGCNTGYYDLIGIGNTFGSNGQRVSLAHGINPCYGGRCFNCHFCAPFFGSDGGAHGLPGSLGSPCNHDFGDRCMVQQFVPYPGGLINTRGGWVPYRHTAINIGGDNGKAQRTNMFFGYSSSNREHGIPGMGGYSSITYCGNCYCGGAGNAGQLIITYG